jgi:hypothetical protein
VNPFFPKGLWRLGWRERAEPRERCRFAGARSKYYQALRKKGVHPSEECLLAAGGRCPSIKGHYFHWLAPELPH